MRQALSPCPSCQRHVRASEASCPFCAAALPSDHAAAVPGRPTQRLGRAAIFVFGATLTVAGCDPSTSGPDDGAVADTGTEDSGSPGALYGAVPVDAGDSGPGDDGSPVALYGAVPTDAGPEDSGSPGALYGAVPADSG